MHTYFSATMGFTFTSLKAELSSMLDDKGPFWISSSGSLEATRLGMTGKCNKVPTVFHLLKIDIRDADCYLSIDTLLELNMNWNKSAHPWLSIYRTLIKLGDSSVVRSLRFPFHLAQISQSFLFSSELCSALNIAVGRYHSDSSTSLILSSSTCPTVPILS